MKHISKAGWRIVGGQRIYFRSKAECNFSRYLQWQVLRANISSWEHEPKTFWFKGIKRGVCSYLPDFKVVRQDGSHCWYEVKGWMDPKSATKIKRFKKYFPDEELVVITNNWFKLNNAKMKIIIRDWE